MAKSAPWGNGWLRKDLPLQMIAYGNVYVAQVAMGANPQQTLQAFREAEAYEGTSLILAYCPCIAHGYDLRYGMKNRIWPRQAVTGLSSATTRECAASAKDRSIWIRTGPPY